MSDLEKLKEWISTYPFPEDFREYRIDFTDATSPDGGLFPSGLVELSRRRDILGHVTVRNQYNFSLYWVLYSPKDQTIATANAEWLMDFQAWVQAQSAAGLAPTFGDVPRRETMTASNGTLFESSEEGTAMYMVQLSAQFEKEL